MPDRSVTVLKFGGSVLPREHDLAGAVHEIYRWVRRGQKVVAVVSALGKTTDRLLAQGFQYGAEPDPAALASLVATGEQTSAALLALALDRAGIPAQVLDATRIGLRTAGPVLDSSPESLNADAIRAALAERPVAIVPGFIGLDENDRTTLLGRGGSDFTALFLAQQLDAGRCRLVKDVKGLYDHDPSRPGPLARRYRTLTWDDALKLDGRIVQHKAVRFARDHALAFEVGALNATEATLVGPESAQFGPSDETPPPPLRIALLGLGTVGLGVYRLLNDRPDAFEIVKVAVRTIRRAASEGVPAYLLTTDAAAAIRTDCDVVVEAIGGLSPARDLIEQALRDGKHVVTANKAVIARFGEELNAIAEEHGVRLLYSASVGGAVPAIEAVALAAREGDSPITTIEGVVNGTCNFILDRLAEGVALEEAVTIAQAQGFAEADPSVDLNGSDAAEKLRILARTALGVDLPTDGILRRGIDAQTPALVKEALADGKRVRIVATVVRDGGATIATVEPRVLDADHPFAHTRNEHNRVIITRADGTQSVVHGKGAGRWPTAEAVFADLLDLTRGPLAAIADLEEEALAVK